MTLPMLALYAAMSNNALGAYGEYLAMVLLQGLGLRVWHNRRGADLTAINPNTGEVARIEVKTARKGKDGKYRATLIKTGHTTTKHADIVVMLAYNAGEWTAFVIPVSVLGSKPHIVITSAPETYAGKYAGYRNAWQHITGNRPV